MTLYMDRRSTSCRKVLATLQLLDRTEDIVEVDLGAGAHREPAFLALNPNGKVPVLVDGDVVLWESNTICRYLCTKVTTPLLPSDPAGRAEVERWMDWELAHWGPVCSALTRRRPTDPAAVAAAEDDFRRLAAVIEGHLEATKEPMLAGLTVTLADVAVAAPLTYRERARLPVDPFRRLNRWIMGIEVTNAWFRTRPPG